jgi:hypothetical protein
MEIGIPVHRILRPKAVVERVGVGADVSLQQMIKAQAWI